MLTIYIDKNIISHLKLNPDGPLAKKFEELKPIAVFPYSRALISDLCKGYDKLSPENKLKVTEDLRFLADLSGNYYLDWSNKDNLVNWFINDIHTMFNQELEVYNESAMSYLKMIFEPNDSGDEIDKLMGSLGKIFDTIPLGIDFTELRKSDVGTSFVSNFPNAEKTGMLGDFMRDFVAWVDSLDENPSSYKDMRRLVTAHTGVLNNSSDLDSNVMTELDKILLSSPIGKSLDGISEDANQKKDNTLEDVFMNEFIMLDMVGYKTDGLKKGYTNFLNDAKHAFIGSHCDFFITQDRRTRAKAKAIYEKRNVSSRACDIGEFLELIENYDYSFDENYFTTIEDYPNDLKPEIQKEENEITLDTYYLRKRFLNYFNQMDVMKEPNGRTSYSFLHNSETFLRLPSFSHIEKAVNYLHSILGTDFRDRSQYNPEDENQKILDRKWSGRKWILKDGEMNVYYTILEKDVFPRLVIDDMALKFG